jgi:ferredoxin
MKVKFLPQDVEYEIELNETVLHLAQRNDIHIQSVCKGLPSCAECRIQIKSGENNVPPPSSKEMNLIGTAYYIDQSRLSCQLRCFGDVVVDLSEQIEKEARAKERPVGPSGRTISADRGSHAVKGSIIEEYKETAEVVTQIDPNEERPGHDKFYEEFSREKKQQRPQQGNRQKQNPQQNKPNRGRNKNRPGNNSRPNNRPNANAKSR